MITGAIYVGAQALMDIAKGSVSSLGAYAQMAILGSAVGIINGVTGSIPIVGQSLLVRPAVAFADGAVTSIIDQLVRTGKLDGNMILRDGAMSALADTLLRLGRGLAGGLDDVRYRNAGVEDARKTYTVDPSMQAKDMELKVLNDGIYARNPTAQNIDDLIKPGSNYVGNSQKNGQFMYVVTTDGDIIIGTRGKDLVTGETLHMPHPTLIGGENPVVQGAGMVEIRGGKIYRIDNASGHFKPDAASLDAVQQAFEELPDNVFHKNFQGYVPFES